MYSYEDRIRAIQLYIKLGKRLSATLRKLVYPKATGQPILNPHPIRKSIRVHQL